MDIVSDRQTLVQGKDTLNSDRLYRILIVDDEEPFRKGFRYTINWNEFGFKVTDEASNTMEALSLLENNSYDVIITDIRMPEKSGLELVHTVKDKYPRIKIFILSGYSEFEYAVEAIKMDVEDYILKPVNKEAIKDIFLKLKDKLDKETDEKIRRDTETRVAKSHFLYRLVQNDFITKERILSALEQLEICLSNDALCIIVLKIDDLNLFINKFFNGNTDLFENQIEENIKQLNKDYQEYIMTYINNNYIFLVPHDEREICIDAIEVCMKKFDTDYRIGVGDKVENIDYVSVSYNQAIEVMQQDDGRIVSYYYDNSNSFQTSKLILLQKKIIDAMENGKFDEIYITVDNIFSVLNECNINYIYNWTINSIHEILEYFDLSKLQKVKVSYRFNFFGMSNANIYKAVKESYLEHLEKISEVLKSFSSEPNKELVDRACKMIRERYMDKNFSLYNIASELNISYGYLCTIFKQITGYNFTDYLIEERMKNARRIILEGKHKMYEIADMVGYNSARYFALAFKNYYGVSPSDYKRRLRGEENQ